MIVCSFMSNVKRRCFLSPVWVAASAVGVSLHKAVVGSQVSTLAKRFLPWRLTSKPNNRGRSCYYSLRVLELKRNHSIQRKLKYAKEYEMPSHGKTNRPQKDDYFVFFKLN